MKNENHHHILISNPQRALVHIFPILPDYCQTSDVAALNTGWSSSFQNYLTSPLCVYNDGSYHHCPQFVDEPLAYLAVKNSHIAEYISPNAASLIVSLIIKFIIVISIIRVSVLQLYLQS